MFVSLVIPWWRYWSLGCPRGKSRDVSVASYDVMDSNNHDYNKNKTITQKDKDNLNNKSITTLVTT